MVGVPGKYKGCETCRRRRVKCTNERPYCHKCVSTGRQCEGYEREMVFITGTPANKGRVASHPRKGPSSTPTPSSRSQSTPSAEPEARTMHDQLSNLVPTQPLSSAWEDHITLSSNNHKYTALLTALQIPLGGVMRDNLGSPTNTPFNLVLPPYSPSEAPSSVDSEEFTASGQCLVHVPFSDDTEVSTESYCVFLFEHVLGVSQNPSATANQPSDPVSSLGPDFFKTFPHHHFFVRVYRPLKLSVALLNRQSTFISDTEWTTSPWEWHPKSLLDHLLDIMTHLPAIFDQTDRLLPFQATLARRQEAQDLLQRCLILESQFEHWLAMVDSHRDSQKPMSYWPEELTTSSGGIPFSYAYTFSDNMTGVMFLYYWMAQILFHKCIESLHRIIFQPVIDAYPNLWPDLPPNLQIDPARYQQTRELAANICRSLDSTLEGNAQPDMLVAPMTVALDLYREINTSSPQDGLLEVMWIEAFKGRLIEKGQYVANVLQRNRWIELAKF